TLDDLIPHDGSPAGVDISISIGEVILEVHRTLLRGGTAQPVDHGARLRVHRPQAPLEEINGLEAVNERLLREMHGLSGDTLRNSCFLEQKGLDRIERLAGDQRDTSAAKLVGIEHLRHIEKDLATAADQAKQDVDQHRRAYEVAALRQAAGDAELLAASAHEQLHAARVRLLLEERDSRDTAREQQEEHIAKLNYRTQLAAPEAAIQAQDERIRTLRQLVETEAALSARLGEQVVELLTLYAPANRMYYGSEALDKLVSDWPLLANVDSAKLDNYEELYRTTSKEAHRLRQSANSRAHSYGLLEAELEVETCLQRLAESERERHRFELAAEMAEQVCGRILQRILPRTIAYMQQLLPELTDGRFREVELTVQESTDLSANLGIRLWDEEAGRHVAKNLFSDGTRDQCSLALRLAFALATLPKELGAVPGFIFLDEPLSSFDADRSQALVRILTQGIIAQQFDQVVLTSRSQTIDQDSFRYYVRLENGRVSESNLPSIPTTAILTYP
ncbi:MAG: hypothetical protein C5B60_03550, partial [Chloroflexi bacterium]